MKNLTATLCLTIAVLLGSVGVSWSGEAGGCVGKVAVCRRVRFRGVAGVASGESWESGDGERGNRAASRADCRFGGVGEESWASETGE